MTDMYNTNLDKNHANFTPLSPLSFLQRSAEVYPNRLSIVHGSKKYTWSDTFKRSKQLASALTKKVLVKVIQLQSYVLILQKFTKLIMEFL